MQQKTDVSDILATRLLPPCSSILISLVGYKLQQHFTILNHLRDDVPFLFGQKSFHSLRRRSLLAIVPKLCWQSARLTQNYMQRYRRLTFQKKTMKIGLGGGCHWCTEAVFASLKGVSKVEQGWIASEGEAHAFSEAVIVTYNPAEIPLSSLLDIHLHTHASTSQHSMRSKYRSAIYYFETSQKHQIDQILQTLQQSFDQPLITQVLPFKAFKLNIEEQLNYYYKNPDKPFCQTHITPKLRLLMERYSAFYFPSASPAGDADGKLSGDADGKL